MLPVLGADRAGFGADARGAAWIHGFGSHGGAGWGATTANKCPQWLVVVLVGRFDDRDVGDAVWLMGHLSARSARRAGHHPERRRTVQLITAATTLTAIVAVALALLSPGDGYR